MQDWRGFWGNLTMALSVAGVLLICSCGNNSSPVSVSESDTTKKQNNKLLLTPDPDETRLGISLTIHKIGEEFICWSDEFKECFEFSLHISYPEISLPENKETENKINRDIEKMYGEETVLFEKRKKECDENPADTSGFQYYFSATAIDIEHCYSDAYFISFSYRWEYHDESAFAPYQSTDAGMNYDLTNGKRIYLHDFYSFL